MLRCLYINDISKNMVNIRCNWMKLVEKVVVKLVENIVIIYVYIIFYLFVLFSNINCYYVNKILID